MRSRLFRAIVVAGAAMPVGGPVVAAVVLPLGAAACQHDVVIYAPPFDLSTIDQSFPIIDMPAPRDLAVDGLLAIIDMPTPDLTPLVDGAVSDGAFRDGNVDGGSD